MRHVAVIELLESRQLLTVTPVFIQQADSPTGKNPISIAVGDFNNDSKLDYVTANSGSGTVTVGFGTGTGKFGNQKQIGVGSDPTSVVTGDFNGDNNLDFAVAVAGTNSVIIYLGDGNRNFTKTATLDAGDLSGGSYGTGAKLVVGDFNGDGKLDLAVTNPNAKTFTTFLGQGNGQFGSKIVTNPGLALGFTGIAAADVNGDGKADLVLTNDSDIVVYVSNGDGTFTLTEGMGDDFPSNSANDSDQGDIHDVAFADFNHDGKLDFAIVSGDAGGAGAIYFGSGNGQFTYSQGFGTNVVIGNNGDNDDAGSGSESLVVGDFNGDGYADIMALQSGDGARAILTNDGTGHFSGTPTSVEAPTDLNINPGGSPDARPGVDLATGDFNGDGNPDVILADSTTGVVVLLNQTSTTAPIGTPTINSFTVTPNNATVGSTLVLSATASETNGSIKSVNFYYDGSSLVANGVLNNGVWTATISSSNLQPGETDFRAVASDPYSILTDALASVTLVAATPTISSFSVNPTSTTIGGVVLLSANASESGGTISSVKFYEDTDGTAGLNTATDTLLGTGSGSSGTYTLSTSNAAPSAGSKTIYAVAADASNQMTTASAVLAVSSPAAAVTPVFTQQPDSPTGSTPISIAVGDFNNDGKQDYVTANSKSGTVTVGFGTNTGKFGNQKQIGVGTDPVSVVTGDFNGDGNLDFAVAVAGTNSIVVYLGDGNRNFTKTATLAAGDLSGGSYGTGAKLAVADFNGDGKLDLAVINPTAATVSTFLGAGTGQFGSRIVTNVSPANALIGIAAGNLDSDAKADLIVSGYDDIEILHSNGDGTFTIVQGIGEDYPNGVDSGDLSDIHDIAIADFNHDGYLDFAVVGGDEDGGAEYFGSSSGQFSYVANFGTADVDGGQAGPESLVAADLNGDGYADLAVMNFTSGSRAYLTNDKTGHFTFTEVAAPDYNVSGANPDARAGVDLAAADFNSDGKTDLILADYNGNVTVLLNATTSTQASPPVINSFTITPGTATVGSQLVLSVNASETNGTIKSVTFYGDSSGNPVAGVLSGGVWRATISSTGFSTGEQTFYAVADDTYQYTTDASAIATLTSSPTATPTISGFTVNPTSTTIGGVVLLSTSASEAGGSIDNVKFYEDTDGTAGLNTSTDTLLYTIMGTGPTYTASSSNAATSAGTKTLYAVATDSNGQTIAASTTLTVTAPAGTPTVTSFTLNPTSTTVGGVLVLSAAASESNGTISSVKFYRESNSTSGFQTSDTLIGTGTLSNGKYTISSSTTGLSSGTYTYYAVATDSSNVSSTAVSATETLTTPTTVTTGTLLGWEVSGQTASGTQGLTAATVAPADTDSLGLTRGSGVSHSGGASKAWGGSNWASTSAAGISGSKFITFGLTVKSGYAESISSLDLFYRRSSDGPGSALWQYQLNGGTWVTIATLSNTFSSSSSSGAKMPTLNLAGVAALQSLSAGTVVNFRLTPYGATTTTGTFYIYNQTGNDLAINGSYSAAAGNTAKTNAAVFSATPITAGDEAFWD